MGLFSKKSQSFEIDELLDMKDKDIEKILRDKKAPVRSAKELRKMAKDDRRRLEGERGFAPIRAAMREQTQKREQRFRDLQKGAAFGADPHAIARMKAEDPKRYQALVEREYERLRKQGKL